MGLIPGDSEEALWVEYGANGCYCGLARHGSDGPLTFRGELHDNVDTVMRNLGELYGFKIAGAARVHGVRGVTLRDVVENQGGGEELHGVYRVPVTLQKV
jgi:hypothetical protein